MKTEIEIENTKEVIQEFLDYYHNESSINSLSIALAAYIKKLKEENLKVVRGKYSFENKKP